MKPFVKWAGGKRQILGLIIEQIKTFSKINNDDFTFHEPFVGGGAVFLKLAHKNTIINDINTELINCYKVIRDWPNELMLLLDKHKEKYLANPLNYYYSIRKLDRISEVYENMNDIEKAARTIFLNKTCYNGLYRVNQKGEFNTPAGRYINPSLYEETNILQLSRYLNKDGLIIHNNDYKTSLKDVKPGDIIYVDPPYDYEEDNGFTQYQKEGFTFTDFVDLKATLDECIDNNAFVIISNNATERVINLFKKDAKYTTVLIDFYKIKTLRSINSKGKSRKTGKEVLIMGIPETFPQANSIEKILKLLLVKDEKTFDDSEKLMKLLRVKTYRQVQYYLMALKYLGLIYSNKKFTGEAKKIKEQNYDAIQKQLAKIIISKKIFKEVYESENNAPNFLESKEIQTLIKKYYPNLSEVTAARRASTVANWVEWSRSTLAE